MFKALRKKMMMNITLKRTGLVLLLVSTFASTTMAVAQSRFQTNQFGSYVQSDNRYRGAQDQGGNDARRQSNDRGYDNNANRNMERQQEQSRRDARLSPDERRALRRQIDEAGRDIYAPRR
ncbi:hypothetical protein D3C72_384170 [compost metagenome]